MFPQQPDNGFPQQQPQKSNNYYDSIQGLAMVLAIATTLVSAPYLNNFTADFVRELFISNYGAQMGDFLCMVWEALVYGFTYFLAKAYVTAAVVTIGLWLAARIPALAI